MKKRAICVLMILAAMLFGRPAYAAATQEELMEFAYRESATLSFREKSDYHIRALYSIDPKQEGVKVNEILTEAYGGFQTVYLIDLGYAYIEPIVQSTFVCVGEEADGSLSLLTTPFELIGRTFEVDLFGDIVIERIE